MNKAFMGCLSFALCLSLGCSLSAQTVNSPSTPVASSSSTVSSADMQAFQQQRQSLVSGFMALARQGATPDQIQAWQVQNAPLIAAQQKVAMAIGSSQAPQPVKYITDVNIPSNANQTMSDLLTTQADLFNQFLQAHANQLQKTKTATTSASADAYQPNSSTIQTQLARIQVIYNQAASQAVPMPPALVIPEGATTQMKAFFILRDKITRDRIAFNNQLVNDTPDQRVTEIQAWEKQNAGRIQNLQRLGASLAANNTQ